MATEEAIDLLPDGSIRSRVPARIGLLGNPSDGYGGKVLALSVDNFYAVVTLRPSQRLEFVPDPQSDANSFADLSCFQAHIQGNGYYGGIRILKAMLHRFLLYAKQHHIPIDQSKTFTLSYLSKIPRQRGLSGSSAIACAALNCFIAYFGIDSITFPVEHRPGLILAAENDLGITAGLQDRIVQVYGGLVLMDFSPTSTHNSKDSVEHGPQNSSTATKSRCTQSHHQATQKDIYAAGNGPPRCISIDTKLLPSLLYLVFANRPSGKESGSVHSEFKRRWNAGKDPQLRVHMAEIAELARRGAEILIKRGEQSEEVQCERSCMNDRGIVTSIKEEKIDRESQVDRRKTTPPESSPSATTSTNLDSEFGSLMRRNFDLRRLLFGDASIGNETLQMVALSNSVGAYAKLTGSGGAIVALCETLEQASNLHRICAAAGFVCEKVISGKPMHTFS